MKYAWRKCPNCRNEYAMAAGQMYCTQKCARAHRHSVKCDGERQQDRITALMDAIEAEVRKAFPG